MPGSDGERRLRTRRRAAPDRRGADGVRPRRAAFRAGGETVTGPALRAIPPDRRERAVDRRDVPLDGTGPPSVATATIEAPRRRLDEKRPREGM